LPIFQSLPIKTQTIDLSFPRVYKFAYNRTLVRPGVCPRHRPLLRNVERRQGSRKGRTELRSCSRWLGNQPYAGQCQSSTSGGCFSRFPSHCLVLRRPLWLYTEAVFVFPVRRQRSNLRHGWEGGERVEADDSLPQRTLTNQITFHMRPFRGPGDRLCPALRLIAFPRFPDRES